MSDIVVPEVFVRSPAATVNIAENVKSPPTTIKKKRPIQDISSAPSEVEKTPDVAKVPGVMIRTVADWLAHSASKANAALSGKKLPSSVGSAKKGGKKIVQKGSAKKKSSAGRNSKSAKKSKGNPEDATIDLTSSDVVPSGGGKKKKSATGGPGSAVKKGMSAAKRKELQAKIQQLESVEKQHKQTLERLKKNQQRLQKALEEIKFPVSDHLISVIDKKGPKPQALPKVVLKLDIPDYLAADAIMVWDFLFIFSREIALKPFGLDDFIDLLKFRGSISPVLVEIVCALLRTILADTKIVTALIEDMPSAYNFTVFRKLKPEQSMKSIKSSDSSIDIQKDVLVAAAPVTNRDGVDAFTLLSDSFLPVASADESCSGMKLIQPRRVLRVDQIDALKWQTILRAIFPRLESFRQLLRSRDLKGDIAASQFLQEGWDHEGYSHANIDYDYGVVGKSASAAVESKDDFLSLAMEANLELQRIEFFRLPIELKLVVLKLLCQTCFDCEGVQSKLSSNAEERQSQIATARKNMLEEKKKLRDVSALKRNEAIERCREINQKAAEQTAGSKGKGSKVDDKTSVQKKLNFKSAASSDNVAASADGADGDNTDGNAKVVKEKNPFDPSPAQLAAMLEEMVKLDSMGIDVVLAAPLELDPLSDDEDPEMESTRQLIASLSGPLSRSQSKGSREKDKERDKRRAERNAVLQARQIMPSLISSAVQSKRERDIKEAIRVGKTCGYVGQLSGKEKKVFCTEDMKKVYEAQYQVDQENREATQTLNLEKALSELFVRTEPIGQDRYFRNFYCFEGDDRLFVQSEIGKTEKLMLEIDNPKEAETIKSPNKNKGTPTGKSKKKNSSSENVDAESTLVELQTNSIARLIEKDHRPGNRQYKWGVYKTENELWSLVESLDERGEREQALKKCIKAKFCLQGDPPVKYTYLTEGSEYIGQFVKRTFGKGFNKKTVIGKITGWLPSEGKDLAIWHVTHDDGDEEDLDEKEVKRGLIAKEDKAGDSSKTEDDSTGTSAMVDSNGEQNLEPKITRGSLRKKTDPSEDETEWAEEEISEYQPDFLRNYVNSFRYGMAFRHHVLGYAGLRSEFQKVLLSLQDGLKERGSLFYKSSGRRLWEQAIKTAEAVSEFRAALIELEAVVRDTQTVDDAKAEEEAELIRLQKLAELESEGYVQSLEDLGNNVLFAENVLKEWKSENPSDQPDEASKKRKRNEDSDKSSKRACTEVDGAIITVSAADETYAASLKQISQAFPLLKFTQTTKLSESMTKRILDEIEGVGFVGKRIRRFFQATETPSDGTIAAYFPAFNNEGGALWHVLHDDGDEEDIDSSEVVKGTKAFDSGLLAPEIADDYDGEDEDDNADTGSEEQGGDEAAESASVVSEDDESDVESDVSDRLEISNNSSRLWPSAAVRLRWINAVAECATLSEVSLALSTFVDQAKEFGIIAPDPETLRDRSSKSKQGHSVARGSRGDMKVSTGSRNRGSSSKESSRRRISLTPAKSRSSNGGANSRAQSASNNTRGVESTPRRGKKKKSSSKKSKGNTLFSPFNFMSDRPVRGSRRNVNYAEN